MPSRYRKTILFTSAGLVLTLGLVWLGTLGASHRQADDASAIMPLVNRYGEGSPRTIEEHEALIERFRARGEFAPGFGRATDRAQAARLAGRTLPRLANTGGRPSSGIIVRPPSPDLSQRAKVYEYFDGFVLVTTEYSDVDSAQGAFDAINTNPFPDIDIEELFSWVEVRGQPAKLIDFHAPIGAYSEVSQLTWVEGSTMFTLKSYEGETPVEELMTYAESLTFD